VELRQRQTFPLVPRRRSVGLPFGELPSRRRGHGSDVVGTRKYEIGDPVSTIDWFASARLSAASGSDEFVVRERSADEAPRVALVVDRRPGMGLYGPPFPWLSKPRAIVEATAVIVASALVARADVGSVDYADGEAYWLAPGRRDVPWLVAERQTAAGFSAPEDNVERALRFVGRFRRNLPRGTFVFVLSDFLAPMSADAWYDATGHGWDVVPVVIRDPVWEQSFPDVSGVVLPVADPAAGGGVRLVRLTRKEAAARRRENEERLERLLHELTLLGLEPVLLGSSDPGEIDRVFAEWADLRRRTRWAR
jgi:uncharacterized protein (DUF58 family)